MFASRLPSIGWMFQHTHPYGVRFNAFIDAEGTLDVSTHAPVWGAIDMVAGQDDLELVSTHAPVWGAI